MKSFLNLIVSKKVLYEKDKSYIKKTKKNIVQFLIIVSIISIFSELKAINNICFKSSHQVIPSLAPMLERVLPTVVSIRVSGTKVHNQQIPEEFKFFFGPNFPSQQKSIRPFEGIGSGVIIDAEKGYVLTNNHVVDNAQDIQIQLNEGAEVGAQLIGKDSLTDVALLQIKNLNSNIFKKIHLKAIKIADSDKIKVGDFVVAVGNPFGLGQTATSGIVSALGRSGLNVEGIENFIQTDASINRGNSGGALVNLRGELIGINTAILAPGGGNIGIGFAIPSNMAKSLSNQIIRNGEVRRGVLGIKGTELTSDVAKALNIDVQKGAFVNEVIPYSPAHKAGIQPGDVIVNMDGKKINSFAELRAKVSIMEIGKSIKIGLLRKKKVVDVTVTLERDNSSHVDLKKITISVLGATFSNGTIKQIRGVKVENVLPNSSAQSIGLKKNDLIINLNENRVKDIFEFRRIIEKNPIVLAFNIIRGDQSIYLLFRKHIN
ncbi:Do family serine endopeptidase [Candidatus Riesia pediculicola]|uniref:Do family serine endopeptidase n=1 Tax=Candidatus Riesia pediculicola TaxID=401619 RepID=UPI001FA83846|nr:Do family serine endopeptidase [Candidatus Riesia pediculicola]